MVFSLLQMFLISKKVLKMKFHFRNEKKRRTRTFDDVLRDLPIYKKQQIEKILETPESTVPKEYSPSAKEIINEVHQDVKDYISKKPYVPYLNFFSSTIQSSIFTTIMPYALPSAIKPLKNYLIRANDSNSKILGFSIGATIALFSSLYFYLNYLPENDALEYLYIPDPVATGINRYSRASFSGR